MPNKMERFTARARRILSLAQQEAEASKHGAIDAQHMLLALMREDGGIASRVLRDLGIEITRLEKLVVELTPSQSSASKAGIDLSPSTKRILELAVDEARRMGHQFIGTEHLLLGFARLPEGGAIDILKRLGISPEEVRRQTRLVLQESPVEPTAPQESPLQPPPVSEVVPTKSEREGEEVIPGSVTPSASYMFLMLQTLLSQIVKMVSEEQLTTSQAKDLFQSLQPQILPESEYQRIQAAATQLGQLEGRHVRITLADKTSDAVQVEVEIPLKQLVPALDSLMNAILNNKNNWLFTDETDPKNRLEIRIEEDK
ncbi:MAG: hypothetical protein K8L97_01180 [Anaerolineae bacterium]|nr:hypothetical protein [Anaerolineae bacterium]